MSGRGFPTPANTQTAPQDPQLQVYQIPRIGVVLQGDTIWLDLGRKDSYVSPIGQLGREKETQC